MSEFLQDKHHNNPSPENNSLSNNFLGKIPVIIAEPEIQLDLESNINFGEDVLEIKRVQKNVYLTQCKLINIGSDKSGKLFINGFIRKNIEYATVDNQNSHDKALYGVIHHVTVHIPFKCSTAIYYIACPETGGNNYTEALQLFSENQENHGPYTQDILGRSLCSDCFKHSECFTENIYYELTESRIFEEILHRDPSPLGCEFPTEQLFNSITEKMVVFIKLKLLQNQQVCINDFIKNKQGTSEIKDNNTQCVRVTNPGKLYIRKKNEYGHFADI